MKEFTTPLVDLTDTIISHVSHDDLDGIGCLAMTKHVRFQLKQAGKPCLAYEVHKTSNKEADETIREQLELLLQNTTEKKLLLITDISPSDHALIQELHSVSYGRSDIHILVLDHHPTAEDLNRFTWAQVHPTDADGLRLSGSALLFAFYEKMNDTNDLELDLSDMHRFAEEVRRYDTWDWTREEFDTVAEHLSILCHHTPWDRFIARFAVDMRITYSETEENIIVKALNKRENELKDIIRDAHFMTFNGMKVCAVRSHLHTSILGNRVSSMYEEKVDATLIINDKLKNISMRSVKETVNLGAFLVREFGTANAGGHPMAAGAKPTEFYKLTRAFEAKQAEVSIS